MHIILDFDGTITVHDTVDNLAAFAVAFQEEEQKNGSGGHDNGIDWDARWKAIVDDYMADHQRHKASYTPVEDARSTLDHELEYLRSMRYVDSRSIQALGDLGLFSGLAHRLSEAGRQAVAAAATKDGSTASSHANGAQHKDDGVRVRPGFSEFLAETATRRKWPVSIVSINWSDAWIRGVIGSQMPADSRGADSARDGSSEIRIFANTITDAGVIIPNFPKGGGVGDGEDSQKPVASCSDKLEAMEAAAAAASRASGRQRNTSDPVVYMGDSTTDLECLVHAAESHGGGGIVLADGDGPSTSKLLKTLARLGYRVPHVSEADSFQSSPSEKSIPPRLAWARDFKEILSSKILG